MEFPVKKHRGILFIGDSFTWGEGLYFYSGLDGVSLYKNHNFNSTDIREVFHDYRKKFRFPKLVADAFDTWEYTSNIGNGGSIVNRYHYVITDNMSRGKIKYDDFDTLVWQLTEPLRDFYGGFTKINTFYSSDEEKIEAKDRHTKRLLYFIDRCCEEWEKRGKKVVIISNYGDFIDHPEVSDDFKKRYCYIEYNGQTFKSIKQMFIERKRNSNIDGLYFEPSLTIKDDFGPHGFQQNDDHPNKEGHRIIADNIIRKIKEYEQS
jgi:hypothetical protein